MVTSNSPTCGRVKLLHPRRRDSKHHAKLYAPKDFTSDDAFLESVSEGSRHAQELRALQTEVETRVKETLTSKELVEALTSAHGNVRAKLEKAADEVTKEIQEASTVTVDAREFTGRQDALFELPFAAFATFGQLTNHIYAAIKDHVQPYEYGHSWALRNKNDGAVIKNARMIVGAKRGSPVRDSRTLSEAGITGGAQLLVTRPR